jgi:hypothetical protein
MRIEITRSTYKGCDPYWDIECYGYFEDHPETEVAVGYITNDEDRGVFYDQHEACWLDLTTPVMQLIIDAMREIEAGTFPEKKIYEL